MSKLSVTQGKGHYINGTWCLTEGAVLHSINPADGSVIWRGTCATEENIVEAADAAKQALRSWSFMRFEERAQITKEFAKTVESRRDALALLIAIETGKPLWEAHTEVTSVIAKIAISIQSFQERSWPKEMATPDATACLRYKPQGVVVVLGAFNFPAHLSNGHIVPALLAGNTIVYKPSELTPAVAEFIMECWHESGLPAGVMNCLQGGQEVGKTILSQDIQGVYFTGSYQTGLRIHQHFSDRPEIILALEMGGNNPLVIDEIKELNTAVYQTLLSTLITSGQRCTCARRVIVPNTAFGDEFLKRFIKACQSLAIGTYDQKPEPFMGPVISNNQALQLLNKQQELVTLGGSLLLNMQLLRQDTGLVSPGIIDVTHAKNPPDEEHFGPLVQIHRYNDFDSAISIANNTRFGLAAGLLSDSEAHYQQFYHGVRSGLINWNKPTTGAASTLPFGGVGLSGNHRPSAYFAADYCAYPVASMEHSVLTTPATLLPGIQLELHHD